MEKAKVLILGMFHLNAINNGDAAQLSDDKRLFKDKDFQDLILILKQYSPTKIVVEMDKNQQERLHNTYQTYLNGKYKLQQHEMDQIAFRIAKACNHKTIFAVDWNGASDTVPNLDELQTTKARQELEMVVQSATKQMQDLQEYMWKHSIVDTLKFINEPARLKDNHSIYMDMAMIDEGDAEGLTWLSHYWLYRNLMITKNLLELIEHEAERIFVLFGSGHAYLLKQYLIESQKVECVELSFL